MSFALAQYKAARVETASPVRIVVQLFSTAVQRTVEGQRALEARDFAASGKALHRAHAIVGELQASLDHDHSPELCADLSGLYDFCLHRLREAATKNAPTLLTPVIKVLRELEQAWQQLEEQSP